MTPLKNPDNTIQSRFIEKSVEPKDFAWYEANSSYKLVAEKKTEKGKVYQRIYLTTIINYQEWIDNYLIESREFKCKICEDRGLYWKPESNHTVYCTYCELGNQANRYFGGKKDENPTTSTQSDEINVSEMFQ